MPRHGHLWKMLNDKLEACQPVQAASLTSLKTTGFQRCPHAKKPGKRFFSPGVTSKDLLPSLIAEDHLRTAEMVFRNDWNQSHPRINRMSKEQNQHTNPAKMKFYGWCLPLAFFALTSLSQGAVIWQTPQNISGDTDVSLNGDFVQAYNFTSTAGSTLLNTVTFTNSSAATAAGKHTFAVLSPSSTVDIQSSAGTTGAFNGLSSNYQSLLSQVIRTGGGTTNGGPDPGVANDTFYNAYTFTLQGLVADHTYEIQIWINDSRNVTTALNGVGRLDRGDEWSVLVDYNVGNANGGVGQYVIGTFTATGTTESFTFDTYQAATNNVALLNAYQLRDISSVPEPSLTLLGVLGLGGLAFRRRRVA